MTPFGILEKSAQAKWRTAKGLAALWDRLGLKKDNYEFGEIGLARSRHLVADVLQGARPNRMADTLSRAITRMRLPVASHFDDGKVIFRGLDPTERVRDLFFGGGYYGGAVLHGSPRREIARRFGNVIGANNGLNVMALFKPHRMQTYGGNYSVESVLENAIPRPWLTHDPLAKGTYETAISARHNPPIGLLVKGLDRIERFVSPSNNRAQKALGGLLSELGARGGPPRNKYIFSNGPGVGNVSRQQVDELFTWQPGTPEYKKDVGDWLEGLRAKTPTNSPYGADFDKLKHLFGV